MLSQMCPFTSIGAVFDSEMRNSPGKMANLFEIDNSQ